MNKMVIICVDDEKVLLKSLKEEIIRIFGYIYEVVVAESASEAIEIIQELKGEGQEIPLVIADYIMPEMNGAELLREVHKVLPQTCKVILSGQADIEGIANAVNEAQLFKYLEKPWDKEELKSTIVEAISLYLADKENKELIEKNSILENELEEIQIEIETRAKECTDSADILEQIQTPLLEVKASIELIDKSLRHPKGFNNVESANLYSKIIHEIDSLIKNLNQIKNKNRKDEAL
ncbi:MAG: response regulator [Clostridia bacterium]|nr:response regulator [Clostridia bacterium]